MSNSCHLCSYPTLIPHGWIKMLIPRLSLSNFRFIAPKNCLFPCLSYVRLSGTLQKKGGSFDRFIRLWDLVIPVLLSEIQKGRPWCYFWMVLSMIKKVLHENSNTWTWEFFLRITLYQMHFFLLQSTRGEYTKNPPQRHCTTLVKRNDFAECLWKFLVYFTKFHFLHHSNSQAKAKGNFVE